MGPERNGRKERRDYGSRDNVSPPGDFVLVHDVFGAQKKTTFTSLLYPSPRLCGVSKMSQRAYTDQRSIRENTVLAIVGQAPVVRGQQMSVEHARDAATIVELVEYGRDVAIIKVLAGERFLMSGIGPKGSPYPLPSIPDGEVADYWIVKGSA